MENSPALYNCANKQENPDSTFVFTYRVWSLGVSHRSVRTATRSCLSHRAWAPPTWCLRSPSPLESSSRRGAWNWKGARLGSTGAGAQWGHGTISPLASGTIPAPVGSILASTGLVRPGWEVAPWRRRIGGMSLLSTERASERERESGGYVLFGSVRFDLVWFGSLGLLGFWVGWVTLGPVSGSSYQFMNLPLRNFKRFI